jgi:tetratricopeptide (TPR) repeat protein
MNMKIQTTVIAAVAFALSLSAVLPTARADDALFWTAGVPIHSGDRPPLSWGTAVRANVYRYDSLIQKARLLQEKNPLHHSSRIIALLERAIALDKTRKTAFLLLVHHHLAGGRPKVALRVLAKLPAAPNNTLPPTAKLLSARIHVRLGHYEKAMHRYRALVDQANTRRTKVALLNNAALCAVAAGRLLNALRWYQQALETLAHYLPALYGKAIALLKDGQFPKGLSALRALKKADPDLKMLRGSHIYFLPARDRWFYWAAVFSAHGCSPQAAAMWRRYFNKTNHRDPYRWAARKLRTQRFSLSKRASPSQSTRKWCRKQYKKALSSFSAQSANKGDTE